MNSRGDPQGTSSPAPRLRGGGLQLIVLKPLPPLGGGGGPG